MAPKKKATSGKGCSKLLAHNFLPTLTKPAAVIGDYISIQGKDFPGCPHADKEKWSSTSGSATSASSPSRASCSRRTVLAWLMRLPPRALPLPRLLPPPMLEWHGCVHHTRDRNHTSCVLSHVLQTMLQVVGLWTSAVRRPAMDSRHPAVEYSSTHEYIHDK